MWRNFSLLLGFRFSSFVFFIHFPCYYWLYISNQTPGWIIHTNMISTRNFSFGVPQLNLISEWYPSRYELLITMAWYLYTISTLFEERTKLKTEIWISPPIYIYLDKTQRIFDMDIIIIKTIHILVCLYSSKVWAYEIHKSNSGLG